MSNTRERFGAGSTRAVALVKRVMSFGEGWVRARGALGRTARARGLLRSDALFVRAVQTTTLVTRALASTPPRKLPTPTERLALTVFAAQLRHLGGMLVPADGDLDPATPEGALAELVLETLGMIDTLLGKDPQIGIRSARLLRDPKEP